MGMALQTHRDHVGTDLASDGYNLRTGVSCDASNGDWNSVVPQHLLYAPKLRLNLFFVFEKFGHLHLWSTIGDMKDVHGRPELRREVYCIFMSQ